MKIEPLTLIYLWDTIKSYVRIKSTDIKKLSVWRKLKTHVIQMQYGIPNRILQQKKLVEN